MNKPHASLPQNYLLVACMAANCFANVPLWLLPEILSDSMSALSLSAFQASAVVSAETIMMALSSIILSARDFRFSYRKLASIAALLGLAGNVLSSFAPNFAYLFLARAIAGAGEGAVLMAANALVADFEKPDRAYAHMNTVNIIYGSLAFFTLPLLFPQREGLTVFLIVAIAMVPLIVPFFWLSGRPVHRASHGALAEGATPVPILTLASCALFGSMLLLGTAGGACWAFLVEFGKQANMSQEQIDWAISVSTVSAIAGSAMVSVLGTRFGRMVPVLVMTSVAAAASIGVSHSHSASLFRVSAIALLIAVYFLLPYFLGYGAQIDRSGRVSAIVSAVFMVTSGSLGPLVAGVIDDQAGLANVGSFTAGFCGFSALLTVVTSFAIHARGNAAMTLRGVTAE